MKKKKSREQYLGRLTDEEYRALLDEHEPPARDNLGRMTDEEYKEMWNGNPPEERN